MVNILTKLSSGHRSSSTHVCKTALRIFTEQGHLPDLAAFGSDIFLARQIGEQTLNGTRSCHTVSSKPITAHESVGGNVGGKLQKSSLRKHLGQSKEWPK